MLNKSLSLSFWFCITLLLSSCQTTTEISTENHNIYNILNSTVSANFAPDGRLWRLIPTKHAMYADYSTNFGKTYSTPVRINKHDQKISAWSENPPAIEITPAGRIYVLYYADEQQKSTSFLSYSDNNGLTFSTPSLISNQAESAMHYMDKMLVTADNNVHLFWHDTRNAAQDSLQGNGIVSLFHTMKTTEENAILNNQFVSSGICSCCRSATAATSDGKPIVLARMVFEDGSRDHALIQMTDKNASALPQRVTHDNWNLEACPEHGPALSIDNSDRSHLTWFTLGNTRQGIFYAYTDDFGKTVSAPVAIGNANKLPSHPDVLSLDKRVVITWKEFDGVETSIHTMESLDRGYSWTNKSTRLKSQSKSSHPKLISDDKNIFLSWTSSDLGHQIEKI